MAPDEAERRFADMLEQAGLPCFTSTFHDPATHELQFIWEHGRIGSLAEPAKQIRESLRGGVSGTRALPQR